MCVSDPFDYQVLNLSPTFYSDYPETKYVELMRKGVREFIIIPHYSIFIKS